MKIRRHAAAGRAYDYAKALYSLAHRRKGADRSADGLVIVRAAT